jgi:hypothetical protein
MLNILASLSENDVFITPHMHIFNNLPLLYSFVRDLPEDGHADPETCRRHIVK